MGTTASSSGAVGAPINPRVDYAYNMEKKTGKTTMIDTPVLINLQHGSIRYRDIEEKDEPHSSRRRRERPHEGPDRVQKKGYFYHAHLEDFSENAELNKEAAFKFRYVCQGPRSSKQKKVYYVYGVGMDAIDPGIIRKDETPKIKNCFWNENKRQPTHAYFKLELLPQEAELEMDTVEELENEAFLHDAHEALMTYEFKLTDTERVSILKERLSVKILKPVSQLHLAHDSSELRDQDVIGDLRRDEQRSFKVFRVNLTVA
ncbi:uncharacterized protein LOC141900182 [Tubulanus polymorphus]|uniref:uncharacterized protein LOC141900182 n=1 Tax=Tubulanus polymorphus TaxID=672921 RepID=UPI003DA2E6BA